MQEWKAAFATARSQRRLVFVDYFATWCGPCKFMDERVFTRDDVKEQLANYVTLRVDVDKSAIARSQNIRVMPSYVIYDPGERQLIRISGAQKAEVFRDALGRAHSADAAFLRAFDLYDSGKRLDAAFATAVAFMRLRLTHDARSALADARKEAQKGGNTSAAQIATIEEAMTFAFDGNTKKAIKLLEQTMRAPMDAETGAVAWLALGDVQRMAKNISAARDAYAHVQTIASPGSRAYQQAAEALTKLP